MKKILILSSIFLLSSCMHATPSSESDSFIEPEGDGIQCRFYLDLESRQYVYEDMTAVRIVLRRDYSCEWEWRSEGSEDDNWITAKAFYHLEDVSGHTGYIPMPKLSFFTKDEENEHLLSFNTGALRDSFYYDNSSKIMEYPYGETYYDPIEKRSYTRDVFGHRVYGNNALFVQE